MKRQIKTGMVGVCCILLLCGFAGCGIKTVKTDDVTKMPQQTAQEDFEKAEGGETDAVGGVSGEDAAGVAGQEQKENEPETDVQKPEGGETDATEEKTGKEDAASVWQPAKIEDVAIPEEYKLLHKEFHGTVEEIEYQTKDYFGDGAEITKHAYVYLPPEYDETAQYNVLYLMHGIGGSEREWGIHTAYSTVKLVMDNLIYHGDIEPFIIVVPNGRSSINFDNSNANYNSFYLFGQELRNDLIPYIDANYATYAEYNEDGYDLTVARDHRAMAGLSMGGMQTINIGLCECLDIMSYFGAFSAAPTSNTAAVIAEKLKSFEDYDIHYFYNICGTSDTTAFWSAQGAVTGLDALTDKLTAGENFMWQTVGGAHDFAVWYLGFYNFAQMVFK